MYTVLVATFKTVLTNVYDMTDMPKLTRVGCNIKRNFMSSPDGEDMGFFLSLRDKGFKELYYSAPYYWGTINTEKKRIVNYTEGDVDQIDCPNMKMLVAEAESQLAFVKEHNSDRVVWAEGEDFVKEMKKKFKEELR